MAGSDILSGWKEIAHYLGKGTRTAQRYERISGLPIKRPVAKGKKASVMAIKADLHSWVRTSSVQRADRQTENLAMANENIIQENRRLRAQTSLLRTELTDGIVKVRKSLLKLRQRLTEHKRRQDAILTLISKHSRKPPTVKAWPVNGRLQKHNLN
jgi:hypothetical protein